MIDYNNVAFRDNVNCTEIISAASIFVDTILEDDSRVVEADPILQEAYKFAMLTGNKVDDVLEDVDAFYKYLQVGNRLMNSVEARYFDDLVMYGKCNRRKVTETDKFVAKLAELTETVNGLATKYLGNENLDDAEKQIAKGE